MYAFDAIKKHGVIVGILMGSWRILRCNPFSKGGFDPVKENYRGNAKWLV
jgi:putative component of membrane protein insertase Oxa1/YidC/SpoIIIJ protein YidD